MEFRGSDGSVVFSDRSPDGESGHGVHGWSPPSRASDGNGSSGTLFRQALEAGDGVDQPPPAPGRAL